MRSCKNSQTKGVVNVKISEGGAFTEDAKNWWGPGAGPHNSHSSWSCTQLLTQSRVLSTPAAAPGDSTLFTLLLLLGCKALAWVSQANMGLTLQFAPI